MERMSCLPRVTGTSTVRLPASGGAARLMTSTFFIAATGGLHRFGLYTRYNPPSIRPAMKPVPASLAILLLLLLYGCSLDPIQDQDQVLTTEEALLASQIIGESVSQDQFGILSNFGEAFAVPTPTGLLPGTSVLSPVAFQHITGYTYSYDVATGWHQVTFTKSSLIEAILTPVSHELRYRFRDSRGQIIANPEISAGQIHSVEFEADRSGDIATPTHTSRFTRSDLLFAEGLLADEPILRLEGFHRSRGSYQRNTLASSYTLDADYLDIRINKDTVKVYNSFRRGVYGAMSYETVIRPDTTVGQAKTVNGTLVMEGDGSAILRLPDRAETLRVRVTDGQVFDNDDDFEYDDDEFEDLLRFLDLSSGQLELRSGRVFRITSRTELDFDDGLTSLQDVFNALGRGLSVLAEGEFEPVTSPGIPLVTEIEFELLLDEYDEPVSAIDVQAAAFTLESGRIVFVNENTVIDDDSEFDSLELAQRALASGEEVQAEGSYYFETAARRWIAVELELSN